MDSLHFLILCMTVTLTRGKDFYGICMMGLTKNNVCTASYNNSHNFEIKDISTSHYTIKTGTLLNPLSGQCFDSGRVQPFIFSNDIALNVSITLPGDNNTQYYLNGKDPGKGKYVYINCTHTCDVIILSLHIQTPDVHLMCLPSTHSKPIFLTTNADYNDGSLSFNDSLQTAVIRTNHFMGIKGRNIVVFTSESDSHFGRRIQQMKPFSDQQHRELGTIKCLCQQHCDSGMTAPLTTSAAATTTSTMMTSISTSTTPTTTTAPTTTTTAPTTSTTPTTTTAPTTTNTAPNTSTTPITTTTPSTTSITPPTTTTTPTTSTTITTTTTPSTTTITPPTTTITPPTTTTTPTPTARPTTTTSSTTTTTPTTTSTTLKTTSSTPTTTTSQTTISSPTTTTTPTNDFTMPATTTASKMSTNNNTTTGVYTSPSLSCMYRCTFTVDSHLSEAERSQILQQKIAAIKRQLAVNKTSLSSTRRRKTSAIDNRPVAVVIGFVGVAVMGVFGALIILFDLPLIVRGFTQMYANMKSEYTSYRLV